MTKQQVDTFEKVQTQLEGLHNEITALSKKAQNDAVNKFKLKFVNQILDSANIVLGKKYKPFPDFTLFDETDVPTTSDVALMLTQYLSCFEKLRADNVKQGPMGRWVWMIDGNESDVKTNMPRKLKEK